MAEFTRINLETLSSREKNEIALSVGARYKRARRHADQILHDNAMAIDDACREDVNFAWKVDRALKDLPCEERTMIRREYLEASDKDWYRSYYTRTTYYRRRAQSTDTFLHCLLN